MAAGICSNVYRHGRGMTPGILFWHLPGREQVKNGRWLLLITHLMTASALLTFHYADQAGKTVRFSDLMSSALYDRDGDELLSRHLFLHLPPWGYHVFEVKSLKA